MLVVCWNVAGFSTTVNRIHSMHGKNNTSQNNKKKPSEKSNVVLSEYMKRHGADIFCLQEHKIPLSQLSTRSEPSGCSEVEGYESFWSCCVDQKLKGLNGVVTYVRKGVVPVYRANTRPLGSADLDDQGRCIMTDHGNFVLFNVYVPASSGQPLSYKMKFLIALRRAMIIQRVKHNKKVILVGDFNISHRPKDIFWGDRVLFVNDIRREVIASTDVSSLPRWKVDLATAWPKVEAALTTKKVVSTQTTNTFTNKKYDKYRMTVQVNGNQIFLGKNESSPEYCEHYYGFGSRDYTCPDTDEEVLAEEDNVVCVPIVAELLLKISGIEWNESLQRSIAASEGGNSRVAPTRRWLNAVLEEDDMVDAFESLYPEAEGRYTCWHQFTNKRYTNEGIRIDFTLVDSSLAPMILKGDVDALRCACSSQPQTTTSKHHPDSEVAALCAATAGGSFQPVSFEGGGIIEATQQTLDTQFGTPHTGMIYTPPSFSDHIAISLLLDDDCCRSAGVTPTLDDKDPLTRKAQPHKSQKSIASFFGTSSSSLPSAASTTIKVGTSFTTIPKGALQNLPVATSDKKTGVNNSTKPAKSSECGSAFSTPKCGLSTKNGIKNYLVATATDRNGKGIKRSKVEQSCSAPDNSKLTSSSTTKAPTKGSILHHFAPKT